MLRWWHTQLQGVGEENDTTNITFSRLIMHVGIDCDLIMTLPRVGYVGKTILHIEKQADVGLLF